MNDIVNSFKSDHVLFILYADDTNIFVTGSSPADLHLRLQAIIAALEKYFYCNILHLNSSKSRVVYFRSPRANLSFHPNLFMADTLVESVEKIKFLGVTINSTLSWTDHIESVSNKLSSSIGCLRAMCGSIPESFYKPVYCAFIQSHILSGLSAWGSNGSSTKLLQIFRAQKRALRTIFQLPRGSTYTQYHSHTKATFNSNGLLTIHNLYYKSCISAVHNQCSIGNDGLIGFSNISNRALIPNGRIKMLGSNYRFSGPRLWNLAIASDLVKPYIGHPSFKKRVGKWLLSIQSQGDPETWDNNNISLNGKLQLL